jgi:hypothetical protein
MQRAERGSSTYFQAVTPSDTTNISIAVRYLYVGTSGDINVIPYDGSSSVIIKNINAGTFLDLSVKRVSNTDTTASNIVAFA